MALQATQRPDRLGTRLTFAAAAAGDEFTPGPYTFVEVVTTSTGMTVTIPTPVTTGGLAVADIIVVLATNDRAKIGPLPSYLVAKANGRGDIQYSATTGVTVAVVECRE